MKCEEYVIEHYKHSSVLIEIDEQGKKEKMDTRRNEEGWDRRKLYEVMLMKEIPGIQQYRS